jgi:hypothetical protein
MVGRELTGRRGDADVDLPHGYERECGARVFSDGARGAGFAAAAVRRVVDERSLRLLLSVDGWLYKAGVTVA